MTKVTRTGTINLRATFIITAILAPIWYLLFNYSQLPYWGILSAIMIVLGCLAIYNYPDTLQTNLKAWLRYLTIGTFAAVVLYLLFFFFFKLTSIFPLLRDQVSALYQTSGHGQQIGFKSILLIPIGIGEELFWRGLVQRKMIGRFGRYRGFGIALGLYFLINLCSLNLAMAAASLLAGFVWGMLTIHFKHIGPALVTHLLWDLAIFAWFPLV